MDSSSIGQGSAGDERHRTQRPSRTLGVLFPVLRFLYVLGIYGLPAIAVAAIFLAWDVFWYRCLAALAAPLVYSLLLVAIAGVFSLSHRHAVVAGHFPRRVDHPIYFHRRLYGICWTSLYYCTPVYGVCLAIPWLKFLGFRLFGYRGSMDFTIYPDTWIRDLPLLDFGPGVYVSNRATLGTNMVLAGGQILVGGIRLGERALVGHLSLIGPGTTIGRESEIGVSAALGAHVTVGDRAHIGPLTGVGHEVTVGSRAHIGAGCIIDTRATIEVGAHMPAGTIVPAGTRYGFPTEPAGAEAPGAGVTAERVGEVSSPIGHGDLPDA